MRVLKVYSLIILLVVIFNKDVVYTQEIDLSGISLGNVYSPLPDYNPGRGFYIAPSRENIRKEQLLDLDVKLIYYNSYRDFFEKLGMSAEASLRYGIFKADAAIHNSGVRTTKKRFIKFIVYATKKLLREECYNPPLSQVGLQMLERRVQKCQSFRFAKEAGGNYIGSVIKGGLIAAEYTIKIEDENKFAELKSFIDSDWGSGSAGLDLVKLNHDLKSKVSIDVNIKQIGGDAISSNNILGLLNNFNSSNTYEHVKTVLIKALDNVTESNAKVIDYETHPLINSALFISKLNDTCNENDIADIYQFNLSLESELENLAEQKNQIRALLHACETKSELFLASAYNEINSIKSNIDSNYTTVYDLLKENIKNEFNPDYKAKGLPSIVYEDIKLKDYLIEPNSSLCKVLARTLCKSKPSCPSGNNWSGYGLSFLDIGFEFPELISSVTIYIDNHAGKTVGVKDQNNRISINYKTHSTSDTNEASIKSTGNVNWPNTENAYKMHIEINDVFGSRHKIKVKKKIDVSGNNCSYEQYLN